MSNKELFLILPLFIILSCKPEIQVTEEPVDFSISSPKQGWAYYEGVKIMLAVNVDTNDILWSSNLSGYIGTGNHITVFLPEGLHCISAVIRGVSRERSIYVSPLALNKDTRLVLINYSPMDILIKAGNCFSYLFTHEGNVNDFTILPNDVIEQRSRMVNFKASAIEYPLLRDFHAAMPKSPDIAVSQNQAINTRKGRLSNIGITGGKRTFFVINTKTQLALPHEIQAELFYQSDALSVWLPEGYNMSNSLIFDDCIQRIETIVLPRIENLWGKSADIDGDGRIALLFSHTLNDEQVAIGFFNPSDFFKRNEDTHSDAYNYASNEMDIIYVAIPDTEPNSSYSLQNVIATIAHELTHACTFTSKTYNRILNGDSNAKREDLFLDEGLSHLTENLCGFGVSGGNVRFLKRFLEDTSMYSLCGPNRIGQNDSAGMRGAMTLFLSWLFWKSGGMSWDASNQILLNDKGGILFLRKLANSAKTGLDNIENSFGKPVYLLFNEMLDEINRYRMTGRSFNYITDPITNEAVDFFVNMGALHYSDNAEPVIIGFPVSGSAYGANTLLPWSFIFFDPFTNNNDMLLTIKATKNNGGVFFACSN